MGKIYKVRSGKNGKRTLSEALEVATDTLELPENAISLQVHSGCEIKAEVDHEKK